MKNKFTGRKSAVTQQRINPLRFSSKLQVYASDEN